MQVVTRIALDCIFSFHHSSKCIPSPKAKDPGLIVDPTLGFPKNDLLKAKLEKNCTTLGFVESGILHEIVPNRKCVANKKYKYLDKNLGR